MADLNDEHSRPAGRMPRMRARLPLQLRSQQRVAAVLKAAESMIEAVGPEDTSIPDIAAASGVPRSSIYQFFPDKYVLFAAISAIHLARVADEVLTVGERHKALGYPDIIPILVNGACDYYDSVPVASKLILGGPFSQETYRSQIITIGNIGQNVRRLLGAAATPLILPDEPDVATLAVEISFACMKHGYYRNGYLSKITREESARASIAYISTWMKPKPAP